MRVYLFGVLFTLFSVSEINGASFASRSFQKIPGTGNGNGNGIGNGIGNGNGGVGNGKGQGATNGNGNGVSVPVHGGFIVLAVGSAVFIACRVRRDMKISKSKVTLSDDLMV